MGCDFYIIKLLKFKTSCNIEVFIKVDTRPVYCLDYVNHNSNNYSEIFRQFAIRHHNYIPKFYIYKNYEWINIDYIISHSIYECDVNIFDNKCLFGRYKYRFNDNEEDDDISEQIIIPDSDIIGFEEYAEDLRNIFSESIKKRFSFYKREHNKFYKNYYEKHINMCNKFSLLPKLPKDMINVIVNECISEFNLTIKDIIMIEYIHER